MNRALIILPILLAPFFVACVDEKDTEELQPLVELLSPLPCDTLYFDEPFTFMLKIEDPSQSGLGSLSFDAHNNFNHHSHGSHASCLMDDKKDADNPWEDVWIYTLPDDKTEHVFELEIIVPMQDDDDNLYDSGDYHFHIYVTNSEGYQAFTSFDFKLLRP
jgi:hypothetical protein